jgi:hypothetical protein
MKLLILRVLLVPAWLFVLWFVFWYFSRWPGK